MNLLSNLLIGRQTIELIREAREVIHLQQKRMKRVELDSTRALLNMALSWRISIEQPEVDVRDKLDAAIEDLTDQMARLEEHVC